jgi:hypothetical protein
MRHTFFGHFTFVTAHKCVESLLFFQRSVAINSPSFPREIVSTSRTSLSQEHNARIRGSIWLAGNTCSSFSITTARAGLASRTRFGDFAGFAGVPAARFAGDPNVRFCRVCFWGVGFFLGDALLFRNASISRLQVPRPVSGSHVLSPDVYPSHLTWNSRFPLTILES